jgi:histidinol-phosphate aminotransferase
MKPEPNPHLLAIHRVDDAMGERAAFVRLDRNERVTPFPEATVRAMLSAVTPETLCAYPDPSPLYERLSRDLGVPVDHLYLTPGSDAAIRMVFQTYVRPGDRVVMPDPTYAMYPIYTRMFQAVPDLVAYDRDRRLDLDRFTSRLRQGARLVALPNPDQPTGAVVSLAQLRALASAAAAVGATLPSVHSSSTSRSCPSGRLSTWKLTRLTGEKFASRTMALMGRASGSRRSAGT